MVKLSKMSSQERRDLVAERWVKEGVDTKYKKIYTEGDYFRSQESFPNAMINRQGKFIVLCASYRKVSAQVHESLMMGIVKAAKESGYLVFRVAMIQEIGPDDPGNTLLQDILYHQIEGYIAVSRMRPVPSKRSGHPNAVDWASKREVARLVFNLLGERPDWRRMMDDQQSYVSDAISRFNPKARVVEVLSVLSKSGYLKQVTKILLEYKDDSVSLKSIIREHKENRKRVSNKYSAPPEVTDQSICDFLKANYHFEKELTVENMYDTSVFGGSMPYRIRYAPKSILSEHNRKKGVEYREADKKMALRVLLYAILHGYTKEDDAFAKRLGEVPSVLYMMTGGKGETKKFQSTGYGMLDLLNADILEVPAYLSHKSGLLASTAAAALS